jgi:hypothetical protein
MIQEVKNKSEGGLKMKLTLTNGMGFDINSRLESIKTAANIRIENIEKEFFDRMKDSAVGLEKSVVQNLYNLIDGHLDSKIARFFESIADAEELARSAVMKIQAAAIAIEMMSPDSDEVTAAKREKIIASLIHVEAEATKSLEKIKQKIKQMELNSFSRIESAIEEKSKALDLNIDGVIKTNRERLDATLVRAGEMLDAVMLSIDESAKRTEAHATDRISKALETHSRAKLEEFVKSIVEIGNQTTATAALAKERVLESEAQVVSRLDSLFDELLSNKRKQIDIALRALQDDSTKHLEDIKKIIKETEDSILTKTDAAVQNVLENKKAKFLNGLWVGDDIGKREAPVGDCYSRGEFIGFRLQAVKEAPESSAQSVGRMTFNPKDGSVFVDCGWGTKSIFSNKVTKNIFWPTATTRVEIDLSKDKIKDARETIWQLCDTANYLERVHCRISTPAEKVLVIEVDTPLTTGSYRIIGVE